MTETADVWGDAGRFHLPDERWDCAACEMAWPCRTTRDELSGDTGMRRALVEQAMRGYLQDALVARPDLPARELADRHLGWIADHESAAGSTPHTP
ncbi:MAG: hypothetical protein HOV77_04250 [Hamadaea sp.]|uniref:hypothetical protein n=1 Tax=Hamadaea sp. TaxID=2024425 RepID=UPI0017D31872|nr:hypothetical protein [Hamadaea sp.]NUT18373.1 hypothetical protein [Hamadaea sp.]